MEREIMSGSGFAALVLRSIKFFNQYQKEYEGVK